MGSLLRQLTTIIFVCYNVFILSKVQYSMKYSEIIKKRFRDFVGSIHFGFLNSKRGFEEIYFYICVSVVDSRVQNFHLILTKAAPNMYFR